MSKYKKSEKKYKQEDVILHAKPNDYRYCVNINHKGIEPLYDYFRKRIRCGNFPVDDNQRRYFERIIINMCWDGYIKVPSWIMQKTTYNRMIASQWWEIAADIIYDMQYNAILYMHVREEIRLIQRILIPSQYGMTAMLDKKDREVLERIRDTDKALADELLECVEWRAEA